MFGLGGLARSLVNPVSLMQIAMGPAGWASLAMRTIGAQIGMNAIQQLGQRLGLPQPMIDMAQASFAQSAGMPGLARQNIAEAVNGMADQFNLSPRDTAQLTSAATTDVNEIIEKFAEAIKQGERESESASRRGKGRSWLQVIADSMAKVLDQKVEDMDRLAQKLDKQGKNKSVSLSTDLQVAGQEFSFLMNTTSTVIKTIGEGLSAMARKQ
ncbi:hypothetical protein [Qipengyuania sp. DGS5-3]|uniref:hypothetical protein n=1 Tax=Qipengyuania sp. DGS5-3 TaxID=3349632 RepID=UPI0036D27CA1